MRRSEQNRQFFLEHDMDFTNRVLYLTGPVDELMLSKAFKFFYAVASDDACTVVLNTGGGDTFAGLVIYDLIIGREGPTNIRVVGEALSMGAVILQAGTRREATRNSIIMHHHGSLSVPEDHGKNVRSYVNFVTKHDERINRIMLSSVQKKHPEYTMKKWLERDQWDTYMFPEEAMEIGLLDAIV